MKKFLLLIFCSLILTGCYKKVDIEIKDKNINIQKDSPISVGELSNSDCYDKKYEPLTLTGDEEISKLLDNINNLKYTTRESRLIDTCGFKYLILWDEEDYAMLIGIFEYDDELYIVFDTSFRGYRLQSDIDFLEKYEFKEFEEK